MGNAYGNDPKEQSKAESKQTSQKSQLQSSFGQADPLKKFRDNIQTRCDEGDLPPIKRKHIYQIYEWSKGSFDHKSIVIGCNDTKDMGYGFITMELYVDPNAKKIFPFSKFIEKEKGIDLVSKHKWTLIVNKLETTMEELIDLALGLINNHGSYSELFNSCHTFVSGFKNACRKPRQNTSAENLETQDVIGFGSAGAGFLGGAAAGFFIGGPLGAFLGSVYGFAGGGMIGTVSDSVGQSVNDNNYQNVKLTNAKNLDLDGNDDMLFKWRKLIRKMTDIQFESRIKDEELDQWCEDLKSKIDDMKKSENTIKSIQFVGCTMEQKQKGIRTGKEKKQENKKSGSTASQMNISSKNDNDTKHLVYWIMITKSSDEDDTKSNEHGRYWIIGRDHKELRSLESSMSKLGLDDTKAKLVSCNYITTNVEKHLKSMDTYFQEILYLSLQQKAAAYYVLEKFLTKDKIDCNDVEKFQQQSK